MKDTLDTIFAIETHGDSSRWVHFYAYGYYSPDAEDKEKPWRLVEYTWFYKPLEEVIKDGFDETEAECGPEYKQYITDCDVQRILTAYAEYDNGKAPVPITELTMSTPDGCYIMKGEENDG